MLKEAGVLQNDLLLKVANGEEVERPPIWLMRQAGRFLTEYKEVRKEAGSFHNMIAHPAYAAEVTLQPVDLIGVDAAIIFSDILVIPEAMGLPYEMIPGKGPFFPNTIKSASELQQLRTVDDAENLPHTYEAISMVINKLDNRVPLIGFAGAPWTIFCYMIEGQGSKTFSQAKAMIYSNPVLAHQLLQKITDATITYLKGQIKAGVHLVQIFDSWAGVLHRDTFLEFSLPYIQQICEEIDQVPKTVFAKGAAFSMKEMGQLDCQVLGLDWQTPPSFAADLVGDKALQGNLDPCQLYAPPATVAAKTLEMINQFPPQKHIVNLGHGIYPDTPRASVLSMVDTVKKFRY